MNYEASPIKRHRATKAEMEARAEWLIAYARDHEPVTVRGLYYQAEVAGLPGITKDEKSYSKVQRQVLDLRRAGRLDYRWIADGTRWMRKPRTYDNWQDALAATAQFYRKSLWQSAPVDVEVWLEKDALAGVILPVTSEYDVPLMVTRGQTSETFAFEAVDFRCDTDKPYVIFALYDFDRSGRDAARSLQEKVERFAAEYDVQVIFHILGLTLNQIETFNLPTRPHKRETAADRKWPHPFACELDAMPPDGLRQLVRDAIEQYLPAHQLETLRKIEAEERATLRGFIGEATTA